MLIIVAVKCVVSTNSDVIVCSCFDMFTLCKGLMYAFDQTKHFANIFHFSSYLAWSRITINVHLIANQAHCWKFWGISKPLVRLIRTIN